MYKDRGSRERAHLGTERRGGQGREEQTSERLIETRQAVLLCCVVLCFVCVSAHERVHVCINIYIYPYNVIYIIYKI